MNLLWPIRFDANEWFVLAVIVIGYAAAWLLPRRFPTIVTLAILSLGVGVGFAADSLFAAPPADFFDVNDRKEFEVFDVLVYFQYPPFNYIFLYVYDRLRIKGPAVIIYVLLWSAFSVLVEGLAAHFNVFHFTKGWALKYSFVFYVITQFGLLPLFYVMKKHFVSARAKALSKG
ncbi:hypothetical protein D3P08_00715 [Paenibacillus nanensis]|uniref:Uncharacterized protein n=1 Tax=Paenibacillus nanensis TaxID=393251 RepID=A0A3A1VK80_9BACL|nr:hypothetical protein [Paenibacillus nanensis]RIX60142.1 hypothetical protein D3P08_00715 [Paenibacillus nanensis]